MVIWLTGQSKSGKTTLANKMKKWYEHTIVLDGDEVRKIWPGLGLTKEDRWEQNLRVARLAKHLSEQGFVVVVAVIAPYKELRQQIRNITNCAFYYLTHNEFSDNPEYPYESAYDEADVIVSRREECK